MNTLEQLQKYSSIVADTGDIEAIKQFKPVDATTNPSLLLKASQLTHYQPLLHEAKAYAQSHGAGFEQASLAADKLATLIGKEISQTVSGKVSTEIDARLSFDTKASVEKARFLIKLYEEIGISKDRILIKIAATWQGIQAARILEKEGIHCNITLIFSLEQAIAAADVGAYLVSPFVGRITDWYKAQRNIEHFLAEDDPGVQSVRNIYQHYKNNGLSTIVMAASFRNSDQIIALAGCDKLTISPQLLAELEAREESISEKLRDGSPKNSSTEPLSEESFLFQLNQNEMAHCKLAEGIRSFIKDQVTLEEKLRAL